MKNDPRPTPSYGIISLPPVYIESDSSELMSPTDIAEKLNSIDWDYTDAATKFLSHDIHPYPAKFIPQVAGQLIGLLSMRGDLVLDPFGGSGTTALEAIRNGRRAISIDANPLAKIIGNVKTSIIDVDAKYELQRFITLISSVDSSLDIDTKSISKYIPSIPNIKKWFSESVCNELAFIRSKIEKIENSIARSIAYLAFSRIIIQVSYQDSETRYKSVERVTMDGEAIAKFVKSIKFVVDNLCTNSLNSSFGGVKFITGDAKDIGRLGVDDNSIDLVVTSPPYGNATDYHLYHRFRLYWLGHDPKELGEVEIGSHLRHQREKDGFERYLHEMTLVLKSIHCVLKPSAYCAIVIGDSVYDGITYNTSVEFEKVAKELGYSLVTNIKRDIHNYKRSFASPARRATSEHIVVFQKKITTEKIDVYPAPYTLWPYEKDLMIREIQALSPEGFELGDNGVVCVPSTAKQAIKRATFFHRFSLNNSKVERTWQAILENGYAGTESFRKDPKYVTHGIHDYKGKFYPQLAKSLLNIGCSKDNAIVFDPFCGSGTTLLEGYLNGLRAVGCDLNPLAAKIARAKVGILSIDSKLIQESSEYILKQLVDYKENSAKDFDQFDETCMEELMNWFPKKSLCKINYVLSLIRKSSSGVLRDFYEVILSSIVREVSQQDPSDLRIRKRKVLLRDADVFGKFVYALSVQSERLTKFFEIAMYAPFQFNPANAYCGDSRFFSTFESAGLTRESVDLILTSPPYATALPYIDTDRLSLLSICGINSSTRRPLENVLIGSREILTSERNAIENRIERKEVIDLPDEINKFSCKLLRKVRNSSSGFRKTNMPSLLIRFFEGMKSVLDNSYAVLKPGGQIMIVLGDNKMTIDGKELRISTTDYVELIAETSGFSPVERINISVTKEKMVHVKNAITANEILWLKK